MPTPYIKKIATQKRLPISKVEDKWEEAKAAVSREKYDSDSSYYAVVTSVFKKMMKIESDDVMPSGIIPFNEWIILNTK